MATCQAGAGRLSHRKQSHEDKPATCPNGSTGASSPTGRARHTRDNGKDGGRRASETPCDLGQHLPHGVVRDPLIQNHLSCLSQTQIPRPQLKATESASLGLGLWICILNSRPLRHCRMLRFESLMSPSLRSVLTCIHFLKRHRGSER